MKPIIENKCGECSMCCKLMTIPELDKKDGQWCRHVKLGKGCTIYKDRPETCVGFKCIWLQGNLGSDISLRPDKCKVVLGTGTNGIVAAFVDKTYPLAWMDEPMYSVLKQLAIMTGRVVIGVGDSTEKTLLERIGPDAVTKRTIYMTPPDENGIQWFHGGN